MSQINHVKVLGGLLKSIVDHSSFQYIQSVLDENDKLKQETTKLKHANEFNDEKLVRLKIDLDSTKKQSQDKDVKLQTHAKERTELTGKLANKTKELEENAKQMTKLQEELKKRDAKIGKLETGLRAEQEKTKDRESLQKQLASTKEDLRLRISHLEKLEKFAFKMIPLSSENIPERLATIFNSARSLAVKYSNTDFAPATLTDAPLWDKMRDHHRVKGIIPLLLTNSPAAKQMRAAAFLAILATELTKYIFQPTYILEEGDEELSGILSNLTVTAPERETYLRSILLGANAPNRSAVAKYRAKLAARAVVFYVEPLLSGGDAVFRAALDELCTLACTHWLRVQEVEDKIEACFEASDGQDWQLSQSSSSSSSLSNGESKKPNGSATTISTGGSSNGRTSPGTTRRPMDSAAKAEANAKSPEQQQQLQLQDIGAVVWPSFVIVDHDDFELETLVGSYVLAESQVRAAKEEEKALLMTSGSRRAARYSARRSRTMSTISSSVAGEIMNHSVANRSGNSNGGGNGNGIGNGGASFLSEAVGGGGGIKS
ncbi:hypothetical protein B0T17DRAFT_502027 [Bombardia bombarda]|uniref:MEI5 protein n=1 Tax=Bombardia bombarda TaxID=252184 RepID=A0AA40CD31_9PEZI|nr:hypothetical protein B0T17DRAFT_502027 [Bombardia bombarda]